MAGTGLAFALKGSGPSRQQIEEGIAINPNVQQVTGSSWDNGKLMVMVSWRDLTKAQSSAEYLCQLFPLRSVIWDDKLGDPHRVRCE